MIKPLEYMIYKVLPLVYDDSLSYYECLAKVIQKTNEIIASNNQMQEMVSALPEIVRETANEILTPEYIQSVITPEYIEYLLENNTAYDTIHYLTNDGIEFDMYIAKTGKLITMDTSLFVAEFTGVKVHNIGVLPAEYVPPHDVYIASVGMNNNDQYAMFRLNIKTTGSITLNSHTTGYRELSFNGSWTK